MSTVPNLRYLTSSNTRIFCLNCLTKSYEFQDALDTPYDKNDPTSKTKILKKKKGGELRNEATMAKASTNKGKNEVTDGSSQKIVKIWYNRKILWI